MGKIIISLPLLGPKNFSVACSLHAGRYVEELGLTNEAEISNELNNSKDSNEFKQVMEKYFGEKLKVLV